jgi:hypothetical protein
LELVSATPGIEEWVITPYGSRKMESRAIELDIVRRVLEAPDQRLPLRPGRDVFQSKVLLDDPPREYLVRVFVDVDRKPAEL